MAISNCLFSLTSENPRRFSVSYVLAKNGHSIPPSAGQSGSSSYLGKSMR